MQLPRSAPEERALGAQHLLFHEAHIAPAEHDEQLPVFKRMIDKVLKYRQHGRADGRKIREFVENEDEPLCALAAVYIEQSLLPACERL